MFGSLRTSLVNFRSCRDIFGNMEVIWRGKSHVLVLNGPFAASGHMVHAGGQAAHWDIQNKENSNLT